MEIIITLSIVIIAVAVLVKSGIVNGSNNAINR